MVDIYLALGSNIGDSSAILRSAFAALNDCLVAARISRFWLSCARYIAGQPDYVNAAIHGRTRLSPRELLNKVNSIESAHGRDRSVETFKGPRLLDIDILLYGESLVAEPDLVIPHPGLRERKFALLPLLELDPSLREPHSGDRYADILASLPPQGIYLLENDGYDHLYI
jgi:2-amino-4-hydroxy-6-hydroxymethyldihydropteridine diphosphokinase